MSPRSLLDTLRLLRRAAAQIVPESSLAVKPTDRLVQGAALLCGTLLFVPFLIGYFVACNGR
ncbi:hypothetical protein WJ542_31600 [Paraburkholderia sp. B3]|uniref:hypothetical protein n=1 Tax=Paraburkholderia sp. B3 TaxID=3134791 RepID=UPI0039819992